MEDRKISEPDSSKEPTEMTDLGVTIQHRFGLIGGVLVDLEPRELIREPPSPVRRDVD